MVEGRDPNGVRWSVSRKWWGAGTLLLPAYTGLDALDAIIFFVTLPVLVMWPFWLAGKWLGVPWTIVVKYGGKEVAHEKVRGWRASGKRIDEIARHAAVGAKTAGGRLSRGFGSD
jgi:hypothetical protein